jgi:hypothetical protein
MLRSPTVFEDVIKTICTTNCAWSATQRMVAALVGELGTPAGRAPERRAFATAEAVAEADESFYRDTRRQPAAATTGPDPASAAAAPPDSASAASRGLWTRNGYRCRNRRRGRGGVPAGARRAR